MSKKWEILNKIRKLWNIELPLYFWNFGAFVCIFLRLILLGRSLVLCLGWRNIRRRTIGIGIRGRFFHLLWQKYLPFLGLQGILILTNRALLLQLLFRLFFLVLLDVLVLLKRIWLVSGQILKILLLVVICIELLGFILLFRRKIQDSHDTTAQNFLCIQGVLLHPTNIIIILLYYLYLVFLF